MPALPQMVLGKKAWHCQSSPITPKCPPKGSRKVPGPVGCSESSLHFSEADAETAVSDLTFLTSNQSFFPDEGQLQEHSRWQCAPQFINMELCKVGATRLTPGCWVAHTSREGSSLDSVEGYTCRLTGNTPQECSVVQIYTNMHHTTAVGMVHSCPEARSPEP